VGAVFRKGEKQRPIKGNNLPINLGSPPRGNSVGLGGSEPWRESLSPVIGGEKGTGAVSDGREKKKRHQCPLWHRRRPEKKETRGESSGEEVPCSGLSGNEKR